MRKEKIIILVFILILIITVGGVSYAAYTYSKTGTKVNSITTGVMVMSYTETSNVINLTGALPTTDKTGKSRTNEGEYFDFTISSTISGSTNINYEISAKKENGNTIEGRYIKLYLTKLTEEGEEELMSPETYKEEVSENSYTNRPKGEMSLYQGSMSSSESNRYRLRMWVDERYNPQGDGGGLTFSVKINVYGKDGGTMPVQVNTPELDDNMIAVRYDGEKWVKANSGTNNWYNYDKGEWANAVTVRSDTLSRYQSASVGTEIAMTDIETMWVWIPRYSYTIGSEDGSNYYGKQGDYLDTSPTRLLPGEIDIKFISTTTKDRGTAKYKVSEGIKESNWYTPDAFTFDGEELSGIWVGKFETSSSNPSASNGGGNVTTLDPMIKPNVTSWRYINIKNLYTVALKMNDEGNRYGFSSNVDTHAMKNSEWGVVAYLSQSKYGKLGNTNFTGTNKEIYQNKSDQCITGCSYGSPSNANTDYGCQYTYDNNINGTGASTTGTIYGIYDMSGGAWEYVMGNYNDLVGNSGFNEPLTIDSKYYDKYTNSNASLACNGGVCTSHALSEIMGWYGDSQSIITEEYPWLLRSGKYYDTTSAGVFCFYLSTTAVGGPHVNTSFRLVMSVTS